MQKKKRRSGLTLPEVVIAAAILVIGYVGLYGAMTFGSTMVRGSRENLRATEIMEQKMEQIRLYNWLQVTNNAVGGYMDPTAFPQYYDPAHTNKDPVYWCRMIVTNAPSYFPSSYQSDMRLVRVVVLWTNYGNGGAFTPHARTNETYVAENGFL